MGCTCGAGRTREFGLWRTEKFGHWDTNFVGGVTTGFPEFAVGRNLCRVQPTANSNMPCVCRKHTAKKKNLRQSLLCRRLKNGPTAKPFVCRRRPTAKDPRTAMETSSVFPPHAVRSCTLCRRLSAGLRHKTESAYGKTFFAVCIGFGTRQFFFHFLLSIIFALHTLNICNPMLKFH